MGGNHMSCIKILLMQKDELDLLQPWIAYHSSLVGHENLLIFDNGSQNPDVLAHLRDAASRGTKVNYSYNDPSNYEGRAEIFQEQIYAIKRSDKEAKIFIPLDADEFVALNENDNITFSPIAIRNHLLSIYRTGDLYGRVRQRYKNSPKEKGLFYKTETSKTIFFRDSLLNKVDHGFHLKYLPPSRTVESNIVYIEFHNRPFAKLIFAAKEKLKTRVSSFEKSTLKTYTGPGRHLVRYFFMTEQEYIRICHDKKKLVPIPIDNYLSQLGVECPFWQDASAAQWRD